MKKRLYDEYIRRLLEVNDESKTENEHKFIESGFRGWMEGVKDASGHRFNGDYYYIDLFDSGKMSERPICCGVFLDWKYNGKINKDAPQDTEVASLRNKQQPQPESVTHRTCAGCVGNVPNGPRCHCFDKVIMP